MLKELHEAIKLASDIKSDELLKDCKNVKSFKYSPETQELLAKKFKDIIQIGKNDIINVCITGQEDIYDEVIKNNFVKEM